jgi:hypothetical protein
MTNLSDLFPAGAGKQVSFVASGTLSNGQTVILNTNGTVSGVSGATEGVGSEAVFESANAQGIQAAYDANSDTVVIIYGDYGSSRAGTAVVGTVSGTSISFGTPAVFESVTPYGVFTSGNSITYDANAQKVVIAYVRDRSDIGELYGRSVVGTVSGTSISFGTNVAFSSTVNVGHVSCAYDSTAQKVVVSYQDVDPGSAYGYAVVGTVSGTSISYGTPVVFESATTTQTTTAYDANANKTVIGYRDGGNSEHGTAIVGTVSGTAISFGTAVVFNSSDQEALASTYDSTAQKIVIAYQDKGSSPANKGTAIVGTVSGTSISFGTEVVFNAAINDHVGMTYDANANKVVIAYTTASAGNAITGTVSGTSISFGTDTVFNSAVSQFPAPVYNSTDNKIPIAFNDNGNSDYGTGVVYTVGSSTNTSFIGIADAAISDTASGNVTIKGGIAINGLSSLTPGADYYVQGDGSISTTSTGLAVKIGKAMSATSINLEYQS